MYLPTRLLLVTGISWLILFLPWVSQANDDPKDGSLNSLIRAIESTDNEPLQAALLQGMLQGLEGRRNLPEPSAWAGVRDRLTNSDNPEVRGRTMQLSQFFGDQLAVQRALEIIGDPTATVAESRTELYRL